MNGAVKSGALDVAKAAAGGGIAFIATFFVFMGQIQEQITNIRDTHASSLTHSRNEFQADQRNIRTELHSLRDAVQSDVSSINAQVKTKIDWIEAEINALKSLRILPEAELSIARLQGQDERLALRIENLEQFKTIGRRFTFGDGEKLGNSLEMVSESQTRCLTAMSMLIYRVGILEQKIGIDPVDMRIGINDEEQTE